MLHHLAKERRRNGQVVSGMLGITQRLSQSLERGWIFVIAINVTQSFAQYFKSSRIKFAVLLNAVLGAGTKLFFIPAGPGDPNDRHRQVAMLGHGLQRRKNLLESQITRGAEKDKCIGMGGRHGKSASG